MNSIQNHSQPLAEHTARRNLTSSSVFWSTKGSIAVGIDYDCKDEMVYWTDVSARTISRAKLEPGAEREIIIDTGQHLHKALLNFTWYLLNSSYFLFMPSIKSIPFVKFYIIINKTSPSVNKCYGIETMFLIFGSCENQVSWETRLGQEFRDLGPK